MSQYERTSLRWGVKFPQKEKTTDLKRPCLESACYGNAKIASLLNYFIFTASCEAERAKVDLESCKKVTLQLSHEDILSTLNSCSEKTLIKYLDYLNEWKYVTSQRYSRSYVVDFEAIQKAIDEPPTYEKKTRSTAQSCKNTTFKNLQLSNVELTQKVEDLQEKVVNLQLNLVTLQEIVVTLQLSQSHEAAPQQVLMAQNDATRLIDYRDFENPHADASASCVLPQSELSTKTDELSPSTVDNETPYHIANGATPVAVVTTRKTSVQDSTPPPSQNTLLEFPLSEPDMRGKWNDEKVVQYAEWCHNKRYANVMREQQLKAAQAIHAKDRTLTLEQYKQAHDRRFDAWWKEHKNGKLHVSDMKARGSSGIDRVHEMLEQIDNQPKGQARPTEKTSPSSSSKPVRIDRKWLHEHPV